MLRRKSKSGFTLIELMVTCAIIAILVAVAIPQFLKFRLKASRSEAVIILNGAHKAQMAYFSGNDHFLTAGCDPLPGIINNCMANIPTVVLINQNLGLPTNWAINPMTPHGYIYLWTFNDAGQGYEAFLNKINLDGGPYQELLVIGIEPWDKYMNSCQLCSWEDGIPYIWRDGISGKDNCPC